jgi:hypothetical protein
MPSTIQLATPRWRRTRIPTGHAAHPIAIYVTTAGQSRRFGIRSQHSGKQERDRSCDPNNYLAHYQPPFGSEALSGRLAGGGLMRFGNLHPTAHFCRERNFGMQPALSRQAEKYPHKGC